jgi:DNA-binding NarL/FixJ family response regulator
MKTKLETIAAEMEKLQADFGKTIEPLKKLCEAKADGEIQVTITVDQLDSAMRSVYSSINYIDQRIGNVWKALWDYQDEHNRSHIPKPRSTEQMDRVIKILELDSEYQTQKSTVYASQSKDTFLIDLIKEK